MLEKIFKLSENKTTVKTEIMAGLAMGWMSKGD